MSATTCPICQHPRATADDEADHNTGECRCVKSRALCWSAWWDGHCQPTDDDLGGAIDVKAAT